MAKHSLTFYNNGVTVRKYGGTATDVDWVHKRFLRGETTDPYFMEGNLVLIRKQNARKYVCGRFTIDKDGVITDVSDNGKTETTGAEINITCG
ncbi:hypothetical protein BELINDA_41 [Bacillus phage Belinda]|uniref:hypothetical protein n=1 Tax=Bacillus phage Belinda TaxID=1852564 RepID=UPI0007F0F307|nr:hypothetical protein BI039_gp041 [Bacillus phage Belinda]ANM45970.1 hypothetical protein BELINDA_41 [Bacillus phage Belinda]